MGGRQRTSLFSAEFELTSQQKEKQQAKGKGKGRKRR